MISLIFWSVTIMVTIKCVLLVMRADNDGEGGVLALITLIQRKGVASDSAAVPRKSACAKTSRTGRPLRGPQRAKGRPPSAISRNGKPLGDNEPRLIGG